MQLAIVGRPNVGKSTLLNAILQEDRVLVGPEAGLTRDSIRVEFKYEGRTVYLVSFFRLSTWYNFTFYFLKINFSDNYGSFRQSHDLFIWYYVIYST